MLLVYFETKDLFKEMRKQLYEYKQPVLIYASWNNNQNSNCTIESEIIFCFCRDFVISKLMLLIPLKTKAEAWKRDEIC